MEEIAKQYRWFGLICLEVAITMQFFVLHDALPFASRYFVGGSYAAKFVIFIGSTSALYLLIAKAPLLWYEYYGWKLINRKIDVQGKWNYEIKYYPPDTTLLRKEGQERAVQLIAHLKENHGQVWIDQGVFGMSVQEGAGYLGQGPEALICTWKGTSITVTKIGSVVINFVSNLGGIEFNGYDDLTVSKRDEAKRPTEMFGHFQMTPLGTTFVLRGEIKGGFKLQVHHGE